jgi:hypothetical protein
MDAYRRVLEEFCVQLTVWSRSVKVVLSYASADLRCQLAGLRPRWVTAPRVVSCWTPFVYTSGRDLVYYCLSQWCANRRRYADCSWFYIVGLYICKSFYSALLLFLTLLFASFNSTSSRVVRGCGWAAAHGALLHPRAVEGEGE